MFRIVALVCLIGQDPADCLPPTAQDVMLLGEQTSELACLRQAQMSAGSVAVLRSLRSNRWVKFACERKR